MDDEAGEFWENLPRNLFEDGARYHLGTVGDAVEQRVSWCLDEAKALLDQDHLGAGLTVAATALEIMIRFMVVRPFVAAAFLSDDWSDLFFDRLIAERRSAGDRELLPALLQRVNLDLATITLDTGAQLWSSIREVWEARNRFVHQADPPQRKTVELALKCALAFREIVIAAVAKAFGFTLATSGKWSEIQTGTRLQRFRPSDPFRKRPFIP